MASLVIPGIPLAKALGQELRKACQDVVGGSSCMSSRETRYGTASNLQSPCQTYRKSHLASPSLEVCQRVESFEGQARTTMLIASACGKKQI